MLLCNLTDYEIVDLYAAAFRARWGSAAAAAGVDDDVVTLCLVLGLLLYIKHFYASSMCLLIPYPQLQSLVYIHFSFFL